MKRLAIISVLCLVFPLTCFAGSGYTLSGGVLSGEGVTAGGGSTYIGWPNTDGVPTGTPASVAALGDDAIATTRWVATENGTAASIQFYAGALWAADGAYVVLYKDIAGTITLIGKGVATVPGTSQWISKVTLVVEGGQSLDFVTDDILYYGVYYWDTLGSGSQIGREDAGGTGMYYVSLTGETGTVPATTTLSTSASRLMSFILEYQ